MGKVLVDKLHQEFDLQVEWLGFEIHQETPPEGMPIAKMLLPADADSMAQHLRRVGAPFGITFGEITVLPNSSMALQAAEFAREQGNFDAFHGAVFHAYFSRGENIGQLDVIKQICQDVGLDTEALEHALQTKIYLPALVKVQEEAALRRVTAAPTFIIEDKQRIVGAAPIDVFRNALRSYQ